MNRRFRALLGSILACQLLLSSTATHGSFPELCRATVIVSAIDASTGNVDATEHGVRKEYNMFMATVSQSPESAIPEGCIDEGTARILLVIPRDLADIGAGDRIVVMRYRDDPNVIGRLYGVRQYFVEEKI